MSILGSKLKFVRKKRGMSISEISAVVGCSEDEMSNYELGKKVPSKETLNAISNTYHISYSFFL